jgi:biopolymer transport protein ExbB/TolQ
MNSKFHSSLNRMALFTALILCGIILFHRDLLDIASSNIWLNGIILGTAVFGIIVCFIDTLRLIPEYRWMKKFFSGVKAELPPVVLRPIAVMLTRAKSQKKNHISTATMNGFMGLILGRFEDQRDQLRYITNVLIFLGLLGTFWGLIQTIGGFSELISVLDFNDENIMGAMQQNLAHPLAGMGVAFSSSLLGLAGSLIVGFLELQTTMAQNSLYRELEENLADKTRLPKQVEIDAGEGNVNTAVKDLSAAITRLERAVAKIK